MIDYFDSLDELSGDFFIHSAYSRDSSWGSRDKFVRGVGPTPIKTKYGWLVLYHAIEKHDSHKYKIWAMILDIQNPKKVLYDSNGPILEPDVWYENEGYKSGVVYSCGAVVIPARTDGRSGGDDELFVYYGGADRVSCVATIVLNDLLEDLRKNKVVKLKRQAIRI